MQRGNRSAFLGLTVLAVAIVGAVLLVTDAVFDLTLAWVTAVAIGAFLIWWWLAVPLWHRARNEQDEPDD